MLNFIHSCVKQQPAMNQTREANVEGNYEKDVRHCSITHHKIVQISQQANRKLEQIEELQHQNQDRLNQERIMKNINQKLNVQLQIGQTQMLDQIEDERLQRKTDVQHQFDDLSLEKVSNAADFDDINVGDCNGKIEIDFSNMEVTDFYDFSKYKEHKVERKFFFIILN